MLYEPFPRERRGVEPRRQLAATAGAMLVEANPRDWVWGVGLAVDDPRVHRPDEWRGSNLLGRVLTKVREVLG
jgi:ribA/ribD-fused uncharacterized protein